jgi:hypothetical protein
VKRNATFASALFLLAASAALAQMPAKPGPELNKLAYFLGTWTTDATIDPGPWGSGGKFTATGTTEWMAGNFFLVSHREYKMPADLGGDGTETAFIGYDSDHSVYTRDEFGSQGRHDTAKGTFSGDTWTWTSTHTYDGQDIQQKMTIKILSPASYSMKLDVSIDGTNWLTFMEGKATKIK